MIDAIFSLATTKPAKKMVQRKVEEIFSLMDNNKDGVISEEEFTDYVRTNQEFLLSVTKLTI